MPKPVETRHQVRTVSPFRLAQISGPDLSGDRVQRLDQSLLRDLVEAILGELSANRRRVIELRFGLGASTYSYTIDETARILNVSTYRVAGMEAGTLAVLRYPRFAERLRPYLDECS